MMNLRLFLSVVFVSMALIMPARAQQVEAVTIEGGPILSKHIQNGDHDFRQHHTMAVIKADTKDYGNWGVYLLTPNSVEKTSVGVGYITNPYTIPIGPTRVELTGVLGLVSGYQDYPLPLIAGQARWVVYEADKWDVGASMGVSPYIMEDRTTGDNKLGVVVTTPMLSVKYKFN